FHFFSLFFFTAPASTVFYTLSLHDALPICDRSECRLPVRKPAAPAPAGRGSIAIGCCACSARSNVQGHRIVVHMEDTQRGHCVGDRKSTRLNSSHVKISYAVFCLKKKKKKK